MVVIASVAGHEKLSEISAELERHLATAPTDQLLLHPELETSAGVTVEAKNSYQEGYRAYSISKRANIVRVQATASAWASKGASINTISPGVTATAMGRQEIEGPVGGAAVQRVIDQSPARRAGSPFEIANIVAFLSSPEANFITGNDIIVHGGWLASTKWTEVGVNKE